MKKYYCEKCGTELKKSKMSWFSACAGMECPKCGAFYALDDGELHWIPNESEIVNLPNDFKN